MQILCIAVSLFYSLKWLQEICSSITKPDKHLPVCASAQLCLRNNYPCSGRLHLSVCVGTTGPKRIKSRVTKFCFTRGSLVWFWFLVVFCGAWKWVGCALHCVVSMSIGFIGNILLLCPCPHWAEVLSDDTRLTSVCLSRTSGLSREQRGLRRLKLAQR